MNSDEDNARPGDSGMQRSGEDRKLTKDAELIRGERPSSRTESAGGELQGTSASASDSARSSVGSGALGSIGTAKDAVGTVRDLTISLAVFLYFTGFVYSSTYYSDLGVELETLDRPLYEYGISAFTPILQHIWSIVAYLLVTCLVVWGIGRLCTWRGLPRLFYLLLKARQINVVIITFSAAAILVYLRNVGSSSATAASLAKRHGVAAPLIQLWFPVRADYHADPSFTKANESQSLFLVWESKDAYAVSMRPHRRNQETAEQKVFVVKKADVSIVTLSLPSRSEKDGPP